jgi:hypothetical protein
MSEREAVGYVEEHDLKLIEAGSKHPVRMWPPSVDPKYKLHPVYLHPESIPRERVEDMVREAFVEGCRTGICYPVRDSDIIAEWRTSNARAALDALDKLSGHAAGPWRTGEPDYEGRYLIEYSIGSIRKVFIGDWLPVDGRWSSMPRDAKVLRWAEINP